MSAEMFQSHASKLMPPVWPVSLKIVGDIFDARQNKTRPVWPLLCFLWGAGEIENARLPVCFVVSVHCRDFPARFRIS